MDIQPGEVLMSRSEEDPNPTPRVETLREKLKAHYEKGMKKRERPKLGNPLTPEFISRVAVPFYLFTVAASFKIGFYDVMPLLYEGNNSMIIFQRAFISLLLLEMMINWFGIRYVDSSYPRYIRVYGAPSHAKENKLLAAAQVSESSPATLMPLLDLSESVKTQGGTQPNGANVKGQEITRPDDGLALRQEVERANQAMDKQNDLINKKSIDDLLNPSHKQQPNRFHQGNGSSSPSSLFYAQEGSGSCLAGSESGQSSGPTRSTTMTSSMTSPTPVVTTNGNMVTQSYPYWSWVPCYDCGRARPPRCHHCPLCKTCVLKRDHHCFFAGNCVGYRNHRFFCVFLAWAWSGSMYATIHGFPYINLFLWPHMSYVDIVFPAAIVRFLTGYTSLQAALSVTTLTFLLYFDILAGSFILSHARLISQGVTSFEKAFLRRSLEIRDTRNLGQKLRSILGPYWGVNFFLPLHFFTEPVEDPVTWPDIEVIKR